MQFGVCTKLTQVLRWKYWEKINFKCFTESYEECKSKNLREDSTDSYEESLMDIRKKNPRSIVIGQLYINSLRNKFDLLANKIKGNIVVLVISETKLGESFPVGHFWIPGYTFPFRLDCDHHDGGIMVFMREDIPAKFLSTDTIPIRDIL